MPKNTVILYNPIPSQNKGHKGVPLSLLAIAAPLEKDGYNIKIVDANMEDDCLPKIFQYINDALCVGITCMTGHQIKGALEAARAVKDKIPAMPVVFGGWHPTILPEQTLKNNYVDIVVRGQGESSFRELVEGLKKGAAFDGIKGISYKRQEKIISNEDRPLEGINDTYAMPYHLLDDIEKYIYNDWYGDRILSYVSSFGCPHKCKFCAEHNMSRGTWKGLSPERVVKEISDLVQRYRLDGIAFYDSNFFASEERVKKICSGIVKSNIRWGNANGTVTRLLRYNPQTWLLMKESGCSEILIGAESGDNEILNFIEKGSRAEDIIKLKEVSKPYNIKLWVSLMAGLPYDLSAAEAPIKRELKACARLLKKLYKIDKNDRYALFIYTPYPGTSLYEYSIQNGVKVPQTLEAWSEFNLNTINIPWVNKKYIKTVEFFSSFIFAHSMPLRQRKDARIIKIYKRLFLKICHWVVSYRIRYGFYSLNFEFTLIKFIKNILAGFKVT